MLYETNKTKFLKIKNNLDDSINKGKLKRGTKIPSERNLTKIYNASRMTIRKAISLLVTQGKLVRIPGSGTFVSKEKIRVSENLKGVTGFTQIMKSQGKIPESKVISFKKHKPAPQQAVNLRIIKDEEVITFQRIRYGNKEPIAFEITTVPYSIIGNIYSKDLLNGLYNYLQNLGFHLGKAIQEFSATIPNRKVAKFLNMMSGEPALFLRQTSFLTDGRPFEFVETFYSGKRYHVYLERHSSFLNK